MQTTPLSPPALTAGATFEHMGSKYRIDAFLCEHVRTPPTDSFLARMLDELDAEKAASLPPGMRHIRLRFCMPEEATFVSGSGVCGCLVKLSEIQITGMVAWSDEALAVHHAEALSLGETGEFVTTITRPIDPTQER
ncbi:hypothetical protein ACI77O_12755 [Pseudomonas tritici]|uniref:hypothetical protein n=1 Tax=Pseudomonas tritici TaxID=2745518 RepID=UPI00387B0507